MTDTISLPFLRPDMKSELDLRVKNIQTLMGERGLEGLLIGSTVNVFYLSGTIFKGNIYIPLDGSPLYLLISPSVSSQEGCIKIRKPEQISSVLEEKGIRMPEAVGLEYSDMTYSDITRLKACFPEAKYGDASSLLREVRSVKTAYEISRIREDGKKHSAVYSMIDKCYREDMTDLEFQIEIERLLRREGCLGILRASGNRMELNLGSLLNGDNADNPSPYDFSMGGHGFDPSLPVGADGLTMKHGTTVMVDMNGGFNGYQTDMTRCWMIGDVPEIAKKAHECSRMILRVLEKTGVAGAEVSLLYTTALDIAKKEGLQEYFMGHSHKVGFIGHGIGIELNEMPVIMERNHSVLKENMVIALEPKFVIPHIGAVGVENTYRVTAEGLENLTTFREDLTSLGQGVRE